MPNDCCEIVHARSSEFDRLSAAFLTTCALMQLGLPTAPGPLTATVTSCCPSPFTSTHTVFAVPLQPGVITDCGEFTRLVVLTAVSIASCAAEAAIVPC